MPPVMAENAASTTISASSVAETLGRKGTGVAGLTWKCRVKRTDIGGTRRYRAGVVRETRHGPWDCGPQGDCLRLKQGARPRLRAPAGRGRLRGHHQRP